MVTENYTQLGRKEFSLMDNKTFMNASRVFPFRGKLVGLAPANNVKAVALDTRIWE